MNDWAAELMVRHGMQRIMQGTDNGSPLLADDQRRPDYSWLLAAWQPPPDMKLS